MKAKSLIKIILSALLLTLVASVVDFQKFKATLATIPPLTAVIVVAVYSCGQILSTVKWWLLARAGGIEVPYSTAFRASFMGMFINCFGPGMVGGDTARGLLIAVGLPRKTEGLASVIADRIHGLIVLGCIAIASLTLGSTSVVSSQYSVFLLLLIPGLALGWFLGPAFLRIGAPLLSPRLTEKLHQVAAMFPRSPKVLIQISIISLIFHTVQISLHAVMAYGVGASIPWSVLFVVIPLVNIASSLPISWMGLGIREQSYMLLLSPTWLTNEQALAFGALWLLAVTTASAIGGIIAFLSGDLAVLKRERERRSLGLAEAVES